ncbi:MAG: carboxypeptidase regulatory-like domain-containing protein [Terriglobales bacterium]
MYRFKNVWMVTIAVLWAAALPLVAQATGQISGTVLDASQASVAGARIAVASPALGVARATVSDKSGNFVVAGLRIGAYTMTVTKSGFGQLQISNVSVEVSQTTTLHLTLQVAAQSETVNVSGAAPVVDQGTITVGDVVTQRTVQEIPLNGRHFVDLGLLVPGTVVPPQSGFLTSPVRGQGSFAINTAGNREDETNFMVNGINLNDMIQNQITFQPSIDTVAEFKVENSTPDAQYGRNSGAVVNIATRSGSNAIHGEVFEFLRNDALDARNFFATTKDPFKRNNFGGDIGGAIVKDKLFYFATYEGLRQRQGLPFNTRVLSSDERAAVVDPAARQLLQFIPLANSLDPKGTGVMDTWVGSAVAPVNLDVYTGDIQAVLGPNDTLHGYYAIQIDHRVEPNLQGDNVPGFGDTRAGRRQILTLNYDHTLSANTINSIRLGGNRVRISFTPNQNIDPASVGIDTGTAVGGLPFIAVTGAFALGGPNGFPQGRSDTTVVLADTVSTMQGRHYIQFGYEARRVSSNNFGFTPGSIRFNSIPDFQGGVVNTFTTTQGGAFSDLAVTALDGFVQDTFKVSPRLAWVGGLRYSFNETPTDTTDRFSVVDPLTGALRQTSQPYGANGKQFAPRAGFTWDLSGQGKTVLRGGYGLYYDQPVLNSVTGLTGNPPFALPLLNAASRSKTITLDQPLAGVSAASISPANIDPNFQDDYVQDWNLNVEHQVTSTLGLSVGYVGNKGTHQRLSINENQGNPFPQYARVTEIIAGGNSNYNALWVTAKKHLGRGLEFDANYTWSHAIDYNSLNSEGIAVQDSLDFRNDRGSSDFDARHHFTFSGVYSLPFAQNRFVKDWQVAGVVTLQSGNPFTVFVPGFNPTTGTSGLTRANLVADPTLSDPTVNAWFNTAAFANPGAAAGALGDEGRNTLFGPGFTNVDFSLARKFPVGERVTIELRADAFDLFNHANFGQPSATLGSATFGEIRGTRFAPGDSGSSRQIQLGLKVTF